MPPTLEVKERNVRTQRERRAQAREDLSEAREAVKKGNPTPEQAKLVADHSTELAEARAKRAKRMAEDPDYVESQALQNDTRRQRRRELDAQIEASGTPEERENLKARRAARKDSSHKAYMVSQRRLRQAKALVAEPGGDSNPADEYFEARKRLETTKERRRKSDENGSLRRFLAKRRRQAAAGLAEQGAPSGVEGTPRTVEDSDTDPQDESDSDHEDGDPRERDARHRESSSSDWYPDQERSAQSELETGLKEPPARRTHQARRTNSQVQHSLGRVRLNFRQALIYCQSHTRRQTLF